MKGSGGGKISANISAIKTKQSNLYSRERLPEEDPHHSRAELSGANGTLHTDEEGSIAVHG